MRSGIYLVRNLYDGKEYVGSTRDLKNRWYEHRRLLRSGKHNNPHLLRAWKRDGAEAFIYRIVEYCEIIDLRVREQWWAELLDTRNPQKGYNICHPDRHTISDETRAKIGAAHKGKPKSEAHRAAISAARKGKPLSEATRAAQKAAVTGRKRSQESIEKWRAAVTGTKRGPHTAEAKAKISAAKKGSPSHMTGKKHTPEAKAKMSATHSARPPASAETRAKLSASGQGRRHTEETKAMMATYARARTPEHRKKLVQSQRGKTFSHETLAKMRDAKLGKEPWNKGRKLGPEQN